MKTIKDLQVKITYTVGLNNVEVSDEMYDALAEIYDDKNGFVPNPDVLLKVKGTWKMFLNGSRKTLVRMMLWIGKQRSRVLKINKNNDLK